MRIQLMIQNAIFFVVELVDIHECGGMTIYVLSATKLGRDFEERTASIFYVIMTLSATRTNLYSILQISEGSICIYAFSRVASRLL